MHIDNTRYNDFMEFKASDNSMHVAKTRQGIVTVVGTSMNLLINHQRWFRVSAKSVYRLFESRIKMIAVYMHSAECALN